MKRPAYVVVFPVLVFVLLWNLFRRAEEPELPVAAVTGTIYRQEQKNGRKIIYLKDTSCNTNILVYQNSEIPYKTGNRITVSGEVRAFDSPRNPGQYDQAAYYRARGIGGYMFEEHGVIIDTHYFWLRHGLEQLRLKISTVYDTLLAEPEAAVVKGIVLGLRDAGGQEVNALYQRNGIGHLMAISGLHISVIGYGCYRLLTRAGTGRRAAIGLSVLLLIGYAVMTGATISAIRAVAMFVVAMGAKLFRRTYDMKTGLLLAAVFIVLQYPEILMQSGFLLSFGAVAGIAWILPCFPRKSQGMLAGVSIWLVIVPLQMYFFYELAPYALLLNLLVIPLASVVMIGGLIGGISGLFWLPGAMFALGPVHYILKFYEWLCSMTEQLPGARIITGQPDLWKVWFWYGTLLAVLWFVHKGGAETLFCVAAAGIYAAAVKAVSGT